MENIFDGAEIISIYTRAQAIEDGVLVDLTSTSDIAQVRPYSVVCTSAVWATVHEATDRDEDETHHVLDNLVWSASMAMKMEGTTGEGQKHFTAVIPGPKLVDMWLHVGPGDDEQLVATLMLKGED